MFSLSIALQSGAILLREGLEALLVIAALAAFLRRAGADAAIRALYAGAGLAILASLGAAVVFELFLNGAHDDRVEAVVMIVAAALMLYMSGWLFLRQDPHAWTAELKASADRALSRGASVSLGLIAFLAVFREGGETVLFIHALAGTSGGWTPGLLAGLIGAAAILAAIAVVMQQVAVRLPLRPVFVATSALLFVMGLRFIGGAIQEMQEQGYLPVHDLDRLADTLLALGFNATWEAVGAQIAVGLAAVASVAAVLLARPTARVAG
ncbi:FTR1 family protein [Alsobacter sp. SYSU M60028]|uniref:FTR1 family protein n=1 Tax=Alsobacter ponti TaxID=2962936 RepID=A0ABT1LAC7_9HYPH|nr:FTR1 family protein [Alsobacter ponti]MCP8937715.1 FTR1 family protein [Alsobacter ponti]